MKHILLLGALLFFTTLHAAAPVEITGVTPLAGWKQTAPETFEIRHEGKFVAHLMAEAAIRPGTYYRIRWNSKAGKDCKTLNPHAMIQLKETEYIDWNSSEEKAPRTLFFYSGESSTVKFSLYLPRNCRGTLLVDHLTLEQLDDSDLQRNLFQSPDFESESSLPGEWRKSWNQKTRIATIRRTDDFLAGKQSLSLDQANDAPKVSVNTLPLPILPGRSYTFSFWAKGEGPEKLLVVIGLPNYGKKWKHFNVRKTFLLEKNWKQYKLSVHFPAKETEYPALRKRMARISFLNEDGKPGRIVLDQLDFRQESTR